MDKQGPEWEKNCIVHEAIAVLSNANIGKYVPMHPGEPEIVQAYWRNAQIGYKRDEENNQAAKYKYPCGI